MPTSNLPRKPFKRSKNGCLPCKQRRKKCDEERPCSRCIQADLECIQAPIRTQAPVIRFIFDAQAHHKLQIYSDGFENSDTLGNLCKTSPFAGSEAILLEKELVIHVPDIRPDSHDPSSIMPHNELEPQAPNPKLLDSACTNLFDAGPASNVNVCTKDSFVQLWEHAQDFGPRVLWPPSGLSRGEEDEFDPEDAMPAIKQSIVALSERALIEPVFQEMCHFYLTFLNRVIYNYALTPERTVGWMLQRFRLSESAKLGMLCTAVLFRSNYERSILTPSLCGYEKELYSLALQRLPLDLNNPNLSTMAKLVAFTEIMNYEFYAGKLSSYYTHGPQAVSLVKDILGSNNIDLLSLSGEQTFDVRCFAWCDIFDSLATSNPTHFTYESDLESATATDDKGVEAIFGCPNVVAVLLARTTALRHARISGEERIRQGMELEQLVRGWQFSLPRARRSCMRVARVAVQEIWRHAATLYIHHAIFKSHPSNPIVRNSVEDIIKISSVVPPGGNPDCFLQPTYFIAGTFAILRNDRYFLRSRILGSGNECYLRDLVTALDEIWEETDRVGRLSSWSKKPHSFVF